MTPLGAFIRLFVRHRNAANLLLVVMFLYGVYGLGRLNVQFFPTVDVPSISISVIWPGASAEDIDKNIIETIEPEIRFIDGVKELKSVSRQSVGTLTLEFRRGTDMRRAKSDVETAMGQITTLPKDSERPIIAQAIFYEEVMSVLVSGPLDEYALKTYAKRIRDGLLAAGVDRVNFSGLRDEEIWVEARPQDLRRYDIDAARIAGAIAQSSLDLPSGTLRGSTEKQVRAVGLARTAEDIARIELRATQAGERVLIGDIANVSERFDDSAAEGWSGAHRAIRLSVQRTERADALAMSDIVTDYIETIRPSLPPSISVKTFNIQSNKIRQRISVLVNNGAGGMVLVLAILFLFLSGRIAFWVALGIPASMMATFGLMHHMGLTINMLSMFALIMTVGIIVDDAIVVGEHSATLSGQGQAPPDAAENGARRMSMPVIAAALTTLAAFLPILVVDNVFGDMTRPIPLVLLAVLIASLVECFLILPGHMRHALSRPPRKPPAFQRKFLDAFERFRHGKFKRFVGHAYDNRYTSLAVGLGCFIICIGLLAGGRVGFRFFPSPEGEVINAYVFFQPGTPRAETQAGARAVEAALHASAQNLTDGAGGLVSTVFTQIGRSRSGVGDERAHIWVELAPSETRDIRTEAIVKAWRENLPTLANLRRIFVVESRAGPPSRDIDIKLMGDSTQNLKHAASDVIDALALYNGVGTPQDNLYYGKRELLLNVNERGVALGFTNDMVARAARNHLEGALAKRFARGDEEVSVRVMYARDKSAPRQLEDIDIVVPRSAPPQYIALTEIIDVVEQPGFSSLRRENGRLTASVTADFDASAGNPQNVLNDLASGQLVGLAETYNIEFAFGGLSRDQTETMARLQQGALIALALIYIILAFVFASYSRPLVIMSVIPFGFVGAVLGHFVMGFDLTFLSMIGLLGLSGILVNNSIILISRIQERLRDGEAERDAVINGIVDRLRAVTLTSSTTVLGLTPLLFETSVQAQFLLPMVITIAWGLALSGVVVLVLVPSILGIQADARRAITRRKTVANVAKSVAKT